MKKTFVIQVEYPDNDVIPSDEVMEVTQECIEHYMELHFGANIMDGDYNRIKVKEVTDFLSLVKRMRETQRVADRAMAESDDYSEALIYVNKAEKLEKEVDEYLNSKEL